MALRLPLQSGASVIPLLLLGALLGGAAGLALVMCVVVLVVPGADAKVAVVIPAFGALVFGVVAVMIIRSAVRRRASDLIVDGTAIRIEGGPHDGVQFSSLDFDPYGPRTVELEDEYKQSADGARVHTRVLRLALKERGDIDLAQTWELDERASLASIAATLSAMAPGAPAAVASGPPDVARCTSCGAPLPAVDADHVECPYCRASGALPAPFRERVRDAFSFAAQRRETALAASVMLAQPSARRTNLSLVATVGLVAGAIPLGWLAGALVAAGTLGLAASVTVAMINERRAYRVISCELAATGDGRERRCRICEAPLPLVSEVLARCMHCGVDNIIAYDVRRTLDQAASTPQTVDELLARRGRERALCVLAAACASAAVLGGVLYRVLG